MVENANITIQSLEKVYGDIRKTQTEVLKTLNSFNSEMLNESKRMIKQFKSLKNQLKSETSSGGSGQKPAGNQKQNSNDEKDGFFKTFVNDFKKKMEDQKRSAKELKKSVEKSNEYLSQLPKEKDGFFRGLIKATPYILAALPFLPALTNFAKESLFPMISKLIPEEFKPMLSELGNQIVTHLDDLKEKVKPYVQGALKWLKDQLIEMLKSDATWTSLGTLLAIKLGPAIAVSLASSLLTTLGTAVVSPLLAAITPLLIPFLPIIGTISALAGTMTALYALTQKAQESKDAGKKMADEEKKKVDVLQSQINLEKSKGDSADKEKLKLLEEAFENRKKLEESKRKEDSYFAPFVNMINKGQQQKLEMEAQKREDVLFNRMIEEKKVLMEALNVGKTEEGNKLFELVKQKSSAEIAKLEKEGRLKGSKADIELGFQTDYLKIIAEELKNGKNAKEIILPDVNGGNESPSSTVSGSSPMPIQKPESVGEKLGYLKLISDARKAKKDGKRTDENFAVLLKQAKLIPKGKENSYLNRIDALKSGANQFVGNSLGLNESQSGISSGFGHRLFPKSPNHRGWDFLTPLGTSLKSPFDMRLKDIRSGGPGGNEAIFSAGGYQVGFSHLAKTLLTKKDIGKVVPQGETFGYSGNTGNTSPHLHLGMKDGLGNPVNFLGNNASVWNKLMGNKIESDEGNKFKASSADKLEKTLGELEQENNTKKQLNGSLEAIKNAGFSNLINLFGGNISGGEKSMNFEELLGPLNNIARNTKKDNIIF